MNAAARALEGSLSSSRNWVFSSRTLGMLLLMMVLLASALSIVYVKALERNLFSELQGLQQTRDNLRTEWGQLLLEQNTWAAPVRIQNIAQQQLGMIVPAAKDVMTVTVK